MREEAAPSELIVVVEDDRELRTFIGEVLEDAGYRTRTFANADTALAALLDDVEPDLVITDLVMPGMRGDEFLAALREARRPYDVIIITAFGSIGSAIELIKAGAYDYLPKPFGPEQLLLRVERALSETRLQRELTRLTGSPHVGLPGFVAASRPMQEVFTVVRRAAHSRQAILITGESGTGKELVARAIHTLSARSRFVAVNCGALPETLLESELFGHEKGAFTGADQDKKGLFEAADGGTLFLDEVGELPPKLQPKLLRALEEGEVRRVGSTRTRQVDVRILAASNRDVEEEVREGRFRADLYWRLNVIHVEIPPLRMRQADIPLLVEHFVAQAAADAGRATPRISREAMISMSRYPWPGNVRELRNAVERAIVLYESEEIRVEDLPVRVRESGAVAERIGKAAKGKLTLDQLEQSYVMDTLRSVGGNKSRAAELLGVDRKTLYRKLQAYEELM